jgi:DNA polymerase (family X)
MDNQKIAEIFQEIGDLLDILGENVFRIRSYHKAAQTIGHMSKDVSEIEDLEKIPGIGKHLCEKIEELLRTGECKEFAELKKRVPAGLLDMLKLRGVGPKKVKLIYQTFGIHKLDHLKKLAIDGRLRDLPGLGEKSEQQIIVAVDEFQETPPYRMLFSQALEAAGKIVEHMKSCKQVKKVEYVGSLRRKKETVGDLDILTTGKDPEKIMDHFAAFPGIKRILVRGNTKLSALLISGTQIDLRVLKPESFGAAMHYFTGSKAHNIHIRALAKKKGLKISEYGVFKGAKMIGGKTEKEIFESVGLSYVEPELREDRGEFTEKLPKLIEQKDLRGDLHMHSKWSDGSQHIQEIAKAYKENGYEYIAITDHSGAVGITGGMKEGAMERYLEEIAKTDKRIQDFTILKGCEVDIMKDGSLYFSDKILKQLDVAIASVHTAFNMYEEDMTKRVIKAIENPHINILGHPTGRLINQRPPYKIDMEKVLKACAINNVCVEINSSPMRLDLYDYYCKMAKSLGVKIAINTDGHHTSQMKNLAFGTAVARRGWLTKNDVINTWPIEKLKKFLKK